MSSENEIFLEQFSQILPDRCYCVRIQLHFFHIVYFAIAFAIKKYAEGKSNKIGKYSASHSLYQFKNKIKFTVICLICSTSIYIYFFITVVVHILSSSFLKDSLLKSICLSTRICSVFHLYILYTSI